MSGNSLQKIEKWWPAAQGEPWDSAVFEMQLKEPVSPVWFITADCRCCAATLQRVHKRAPNNEGDGGDGGGGLKWMPPQQRRPERMISAGPSLTFGINYFQFDRSFCAALWGDLLSGCWSDSKSEHVAPAELLFTQRPEKQQNTWSIALLLRLGAPSVMWPPNWTESMNRE